MTDADGFGKRERDRRHDAERRKANPWRSFYNTPEWARRRADQLNREPWCRFHLERGEKVKAVIPDHITPHRGDRVLFFGGKLQSLCKRCHDVVKQSMERGNRAGCDVDGNPTDPNHFWRQ